MKINKKLMMVMMSVAVVGSALVGCGKKAVPPAVPEVDVVTPAPEENMAGNGEQTEVTGEVDPTPASDLVFKITDGLELPSQMAMNKEMFADTYGIDPNILASYYVNMPMINVKANECAVFELKDEKDVDKVLTGIAKRQQALSEQWKSYLPDQYELVQKYQTATHGKFVLFVIDDNADKIVENFNNALNK